MNCKMTLALAIFASPIFLPAVALADVELLTGDTKLACETILCLASGNPPNECRPPLARYFSIHHRKWSDTVKSRRSFLKLCPAANDTSSADMPALVESMVNGAGRCDANYLNANNRTVIQRKVCLTGNGADSDGCYLEDVEVVSNVKPPYCTAYVDNQYTYMLGVKYVGDPLNGGHWVADLGQ